MLWQFVENILLREWTWELFLNGFCLHVVRPAVIVLPLLVIYGQFGRGLGVPQLFRKPKWWDQLWIGAGVGALLWQALLAGYLAEEFATNETMDRTPFCEARRADVPFWKHATPPGHTARQRYDAGSVLTVLRYIGSVGAGALVFTIGLVALFTIVRFLMDTVDRLTQKLGKPGAMRSTAARLEPAIVLSFGLVMGILGMAGLGVLAKNTPPLWTLSTEIGAKLVKAAGYGLADGRNAGWGYLEQHDPDAAKGKLDEVKCTAAAATRERLKPYYPMYGLFVFGFLFTAVINITLIVDPLAWVRNTPITQRRLFSPAAGLIFLLHIVLTAQTLLSYFLPYSQLAIFALVLLTFLSARAYKLRHAHVRSPANAPLEPLAGYGRTMQATSYSEAHASHSTATGQTSNLLQTTDLQSWNSGPKKPLVLVCVSGGGSRSAAWTVRILTELEAQLQAKTPGVPLPYHIRLITGASGGLVGAAHYVASLEAPDGERLPASRTPQLRERLNIAIRGDFLTPVVHTLLTRDLPGLFVPRWSPYFSRYDRGAALEYALTQTMPHLDCSFRSLREGERAGWRPSLVFSPMMIEDGRQLLISNLDLQSVVHNRGAFEAQQQRREVISHEGVEFFRLFPNAAEFRLATAARMNASFPYVFPAVPLPTDPRRRVVDAGYYDNYGVSLAASWLFNNSAWIQERASKVAVIQIRDGVSRNQRLLGEPPDANPSALALGAEWLTGVPEALYNARVSANMFRNDNLLQLLHQTFHDTLRVPFITPTFEFPTGSDVQLNFCLSTDEQAMLDDERGLLHPQIQQALRDVVAWW